MLLPTTTLAPNVMTFGSRTAPPTMMTVTEYLESMLGDASAVPRGLQGQIQALEARCHNGDVDACELLDAPAATTLTAYYEELEARCQAGDEDACVVDGSVANYVNGLALLCAEGNEDACEILAEPADTTLTGYVRELEQQLGATPAPSSSLAGYVSSLERGRGM